MITDNIIHLFISSFKQGSTKHRVFAVYIYFTKHPDEEVCQKAITGLGRWTQGVIPVACTLSLLSFFLSILCTVALLLCM